MTTDKEIIEAINKRLDALIGLMALGLKKKGFSDEAIQRIVRGDENDN